MVDMLVFTNPDSSKDIQNRGQDAIDGREVMRPGLAVKRQNRQTA
jgi:hypothetical protein